MLRIMETGTPDREDMAGLQDRLRRLPWVRLVVQFGSTVIGRQRAESDLDLGILADPYGTDARYDMLKAILAALGEFLPASRLDVVLLNDAGPTLLVRVARQGRVLYERTPGEAIRFRLAAAKAAQDWEWRRHSVQATRLRHVQEGIPHGGSRNLLEAARGLARVFG